MMLWHWPHWAMIFLLAVLIGETVSPIRSALLRYAAFFMISFLMWGVLDLGGFR